MLLIGILFRLLLPPSCSTCGSGRIAAMAMGCGNNLKLSCEIVQPEVSLEVREWRS
jgi:hypothetical protein